MGDGREGEARLEPLVRDDNKWTSERRSVGGGNGARPLDVAMASRHGPWRVCPSVGKAPLDVAMASRHGPWRVCPSVGKAPWKLPWRPRYGPWLRHVNWRR